MADFDVRKDSPSVRIAQNAYIEALLGELLPSMRLCAKGYGYSLTVHGTLSRDIDLVAIPWADSAATPELLVSRLCGVIAGITGRALPNAEWTDKPHGRKALTIIHGGHEAEIDLSIMPRIGKGDGE